MTVKNLTFYAFLGLLAPVLCHIGTDLNVNLFAKAWAQEEEIEGEIEEDIEDDLEDQVEDAIEEQVEDEVEAQVEDNVEAQVEEDVEDQVEDDVEAQVEEDVEDQVEDDVEAKVEEDVEGQVEDDVEDQVEDDVEDQVDDDLQQRLQGTLEAQLESELDEDLEEDAEEELEEDVEDDIEDNLDDDLEDDDLEDDDLEDDDFDDKDLDEEEEEDDEEEEEDDDEDEEDDEEEFEETAFLEERLPALVRDDQGFLRARDVWLVLTDKQSLDKFRELNFKISRVSHLRALDMVLAEVVEPRDTALSQVRDLTYSTLPKADFTIDYNHVYSYEPQSTNKSVSAKTLTPQAVHQQPYNLLPLPELPTPSIKIGIIDSQVNNGHEALQQTRITTRTFIPKGIAAPQAHGTAIASILSGRSQGYRGLLPEAELYAASVFYQQPKVGESALVTSLIRSLDWLAQADVDVINMSLTGPGNGLLQVALEKLHQRGVAIVAAVGNAGPVARPLYPAAYEFVVAVTAVTGEHRVYPLANRGFHIDLAAPGVEVQHAAAIDGYTHSSGTSLAVPFVSAGLAWALAMEKQKGNDRPQPGPLLDSLYRTAHDLGEPGHDNIYGHGLIQLGAPGGPSDD